MSIMLCGPALRNNSSGSLEDALFDSSPAASDACTPQNDLFHSPELSGSDIDNDSESSTSDSHPTTTKRKRKMLTEDEKKANHIAAEQKRRQTIRVGFEELAAILPATSGEQTKYTPNSKSTILHRAADYICHLDRRNKVLQEQLKSVETRHQLLHTPQMHTNHGPTNDALLAHQQQIHQIETLQAQAIGLGLGISPFSHLFPLSPPRSDTTYIPLPQVYGHPTSQYQALVIPVDQKAPSISPSLVIPADEEFNKELAFREPLLSLASSHPFRHCSA